MKPKNMRYSEWTGEVRPKGRDTGFENNLQAEAKYYISKPSRNEDSSNIFIALVSKKTPGVRRTLALDMPPKVGNRGNYRLDRSTLL